MNIETKGIQCGDDMLCNANMHFSYLSQNYEKLSLPVAEKNGRIAGFKKDSRMIIQETDVAVSIETLSIKLYSFLERIGTRKTDSILPHTFLLRMIY